MSAAAAYRPEPDHRRTGQPVRRNSLLAGSEPREYRQRFRREDKRDILSAAELLDRRERKRGERNGPLGHVGREVLRTLVGLALSGGRDRLLDPSILYLMKVTRRSKDAVTRALAALKRHGFLEWVRRFEPTDAPAGRRGPQVKQTSNAYRLTLPARAMQLLRKAQVPDDHHQARADRAAAIRTMEADANGLGAALSNLGRAVAGRSPPGENASPPGGMNPDQDL